MAKTCPSRPAARGRPRGPAPLARLLAMARVFTTGRGFGNYLGFSNWPAFWQLTWVLAIRLVTGRWPRKFSVS
jgi:hypothetical protein